MQKPLHHSTGGLIIDNDQVLMIHWDPPRSSYDFPKGTLDGDESVEDACVREMLEETGYHVKVREYIGQTQYDFETPEGEKKRKKVDYFLLEPTDEPPIEPQREPYETFVNYWCPLDEAEETLTRDIDKEILRKALEIMAVRQ